MIKKLIAFTIIFSMIFTLSACSNGVWDRLLLDEESHNNIEIIDDETIEYQGSKYYLAPMMFIQDNEKSVKEERGYEYICWTGPRFFYINTFYGDFKDSPNILYEIRLRQTYFREDYDYKSDVFKIEGTEDFICFGEDLIETDYKDMNNGSENICLSSSTHTSLDIMMCVFFNNGVWYAQTMDCVCFELSENFVEILIKNKIIN